MPITRSALGDSRENVDEDERRFLQDQRAAAAAAAQFAAGARAEAAAARFAAAGDDLGPPPSSTPRVEATFSQESVAQLISSLQRTQTEAIREILDNFIGLRAATSTPTTFYVPPASAVPQGTFAKCRATFSGSPQESIDGFIDAVETYKECSNVTDSNAIKGLSMLLSHSAATWWQGIKPQVNTWADVISNLRCAFGDRRPPHRIYKDLFSTEQQAENTDIFVSKARALLSRLPPGELPEKVQLDMIYGLLYTRIRRRLRREEVTTFGELLERARNIEDSITEAERQSIASKQLSTSSPSSYVAQGQTQARFPAPSNTQGARGPRAFQPAAAAPAPISTHTPPHVAPANISHAARNSSPHFAHAQPPCVARAPPPPPPPRPGPAAGHAADTSGGVPAFPSTKNRTTCAYCKRYGHTKEQCRKLLDKDVSVTWCASRAVLPCAAPARDRERVRARARRPPPPLDADDRQDTAAVTWTHQNILINPNRVSADGSLEVSRRRDAEGVYQCGERHAAGLVLGYPLNVKFAAMEKELWMSPENATVVSGQPFALHCRIRSAPQADVSWLKDEQELPQNDRYHVLSSQLLITDVRSEDTGSYKCTASNSVLGRSRVSPVGLLDVRAGAGGGGEDAPAFLDIEHPGNVTAPRGDRVVLPCPVSGWPRPKLIWELTPPGGRTSELEHTDEVLVLTRLEYDQEGVYTCGVEGNSQLVKTFNVTITEPPVITIPPTSKEALRAGTVRFNCTATGKPAPRVTWYKDGQPLLLTGRINIRTSTDGERNELVISGVTSDDKGVYQCFAVNVAGVSSAWGALGVGGASAAAPGAVRCWPEGARDVRLEWAQPAAEAIVAYTVHALPEDAKPGTISLPRQPHKNTEELVTLDQALTPYTFQVRAYTQPSGSTKSVASDMSRTVTCQGQGVPLTLAKAGHGSVLVSWKHFASQAPGVKQWLLQYKGNNSEEHNVTLDGMVYSYSLRASSSEPILVRVLGSKTAAWLQQPLTHVPWTSTAAASDYQHDGDTAVPHHVKVDDVVVRGFTVSWQCDEAEASADHYVFLACVKRTGGAHQCRESNQNSVTFQGLLPSTTYEVRVQARVRGRALAGAFSAPVLVTTQSEGQLRFGNLTGYFVNESCVRASWGGARANFTVHYNVKLNLPITDWDAVNTTETSIQITVPKPTGEMFIMVTDVDTQLYSRILNVSIEDLSVKDVHHESTNSGIRVWWDVLGSRKVCHAQNMTMPIDQWACVTVAQPSIELSDLDPSLPTYVMVTRPSRPRNSPMLTIPPRPRDSYSLYYGLGIGVGVCVLCLLAIGAICIWRKRKRARSPVRSRRRNVAATEGNEEDGSEMRNVGGRLANGGGSKDAGEPLLNGHVHITENPTSKTPNGKMKGRRYEATFDMSRYPDPNATVETVLEADSSAYSLLDTSRRPEHPRSSHLSENKLPDDNMNSELTRSTFALDNSKIQPTLQPNG